MIGRDGVDILRRYTQAVAMIFGFAVFAAGFIWVVFGSSELLPILVLFIYGGMCTYVLGPAWRAGILEMMVASILLLIFGAVLFWCLRLAVDVFSQFNWKGGFIITMVT